MVSTAMKNAPRGKKIAKREAVVKASFDALKIDMVNSPPHYRKGRVECIDALEASMTNEAFCGYLKGCAIKYLWRYEEKGGVESLNKATWYIARLVKAETP